MSARPAFADELAPAAPEAAGVRVRVWDLPLRLFHWSLVFAVAVAIASGKAGGRWMGVHQTAGVTIAGLLAFRLVWGVAGSQTARFAHFLPGPAALGRYLRGAWEGVGHNPFGALSVVAMLALLLLQVSTGLFGDDDLGFTGPWNGLVSGQLAGKLTGIHRIAANGLFVLLGLHLLAVLFHLRVKKDDILRPMWAGWKRLPQPVRLRPAHPYGLAAALVLGLAVALAAADVPLLVARAHPTVTAAAPATAAPHAAW